MDMTQDVTGPMGDCMKGPKGPRGPNTFDNFKYKVMELATRIGLSEWHIECKQGKLEGEVNIETNINYGARHATLTLDTDVEGCEQAKYYAILGVGNVLLADIDQTMQQADIPYVVRGATISAVIRRLARVL